MLEMKKQVQRNSKKKFLKKKRFHQTKIQKKTITNYRTHLITSKLTKKEKNVNKKNHFLIILMHSTF